MTIDRDLLAGLLDQAKAAQERYEAAAEEASQCYGRALGEFEIATMSADELIARADAALRPSAICGLCGVGYYGVACNNPECGVGV